MCCVQCPSAVLEKSPVFLAPSARVLVSLNLQGNVFCFCLFFTQAYIIFLLPVETKVSFESVLVVDFCFGGAVQKEKTVFSRVVLSMWTNGSRMGFQCIEKGRGRGRGGA